MDDATLTLHETAQAGNPLVLRPADGIGTYTFDRASYDVALDRLTLTAGPPTAESRELTPEGHVLCISAPDGLLSGVVLTDVRRRLLAEGRVDITLGPSEQIALDAGDIAHLLTGRRRTGRFSRA